MYLTEFDLDLPYKKNIVNIDFLSKKYKCSHEEAIKIDYDKNWKQKRYTFSLETRCITSMFSRILGKLETEECKKIVVECVETITDERVLNFSGVYVVQIEFDYRSYVESDEYQRKQLVLEVLMKGLKKIVRVKSWKLDLFENAYFKIVEAGYINEWIWKKPLKSPNRKYTAEVLCQHEMKFINISIVIRDEANKEIVRQLVITEQPDEYFYVEHLGKLKWISCSEVVLINKKGDLQWSVYLNNN